MKFIRMPEPLNQISWDGAVAWLRAQPGQGELVRAAYMDLPVLDAARRYLASEEFAAVCDLLPKTPGRVLDLGAGNGILSFALASKGWDVTAVEPYPSEFLGAQAIRNLARDGGVKIDVIEAFGESIPLEAANFDVVIARQVLHHAHDLEAFCKEMARTTKDGGLVITLRDHVISGPKQLQPFLDGHPLHHLYGGENAFTLNQYKNALNGAGFTIAKTFASFDTVMNYAPNTPATLRARIASRTGPLRSLVDKVLSQPPVFAITMRLLSAIDHRPGRLVSFVCVKGRKA